MEKKTKDDETQQGNAEIGDCIAKLRRSSRNRESYDEIAELEAKLRKAYVAKELQTQLLEREAERYIESVRNQRAERLMRLEQQAALEDQRCQRSEYLKKSEDYRKELTTQIKRKDEDRNVMMEEARREREILTEVDRLREQYERSRTLEMKEELAESMRRERLILQEMKVIRCQEDKEGEAMEERKNQEYLDEIDERAKAAQSLREERLKRRESIVCEIADVLLNNESEKREREVLLVELITEDVKRELLIRDDVKRFRRMRLREELVANWEEQIVLNEQCKLRAVEQDRAFGEEIMRKIMEDEQTARLTAEARRRMQAQYRDDLVRLIETRKQIREQELSNIQQQEREEEQREQIRIERIAEERERLLQEHGSNIIDFLNKSTLSEEEKKAIQKSL